MIDVSSEISFKTFRSGGKGGQNVNKVETAVEGNFKVAASDLLSTWQKEMIQQKMATRINSEGFLQVRSQKHRSQLSNKGEVVKKMNLLITETLKRKKARIATQPSKTSREKRIEAKKRKGETKQQRHKIRYSE